MGNATAPTPGLGSSSNYILSTATASRGGVPITELTLLVELTEALQGNIGFAIQLNAYSMVTGSPPTIGWQQYFFCFQTPDGSIGSTEPGTLFCIINNWDPATVNCIVYETPELMSFPNSIIPAGCQLTISLAADAGGNIDFVRFAVADPSGQVTSKDFDIPALNSHAPGGGVVGDTYIAPISAFQVNLVGPINAMQAYLYSGAGTFDIICPEPLTAWAKPPDGLVTTDGTGETANTVYGPLPDHAANEFVQTFGLSYPPTYAPGACVTLPDPTLLMRNDAFVVDAGGYVVDFSRAASGTWTSSRLPGSPGLLPSYAALAACQHDELARVDLFAVSQNANLCVYSTDATGAWLGPTALDAPDPQSSATPPAQLSFPYGAPVAAMPVPVIGSLVSAAFVVDVKGQLYTFQSIGPDRWAAPVAIGAAGDFIPNTNMAVALTPAAVGMTQLVMVDHAGRIAEVASTDGVNWTGPGALVVPDTVAFDPGVPVCATKRYDEAQVLDIFAFDKTGTLIRYYMTDPSLGWFGPFQTGPTGISISGAHIAASEQFSVSGQTAVFFFDNNGQLQVVWRAPGAGAWSGPQALGAPGVAPPGASLGAVRHFGVPDQTEVYAIIDTPASSPGWPGVYSQSGTGPWQGPAPIGL